MNLDLSARVQALRPTTVNRVLAEARALERQGRSLMSLMRGQPDTPTAQHIVEAAEKALRSGRTGYPDNQGELPLRQAVAEALLRDRGLVYDPATEILVTDGATCGLALALAVAVGPGDEMLLPDPIYDAYQSAIALWGGQARAVSARIVNGRFQFGRADLEAAWTPRCKGILLNTPWNPVGTVLSRGELEAAMSFAEERGLLVVSDEIYQDLVYAGARHVSPAALGAEPRARTIVVNSLSKSYAMTGWRVGYVAAPVPFIQPMLLVLQQFSRGPATFVQDAAAAALRSDQGCVLAMRREYEGRRDRVVAALADIPGVVALAPAGGLFVMVDVRGLGRPSDEVRRFLMHEAGVVVLHGSAFGPGGEGTLRVSFAAGGMTLDTGLERLRAGLLRLHS